MFNSYNSVTTINSNPYNNGYNGGAIYNNTNNIAPLIGS